MEKNLDKWNEIKKKTDEQSSSVKIRVGEIRWCRIGLNIGSEEFGKGETYKRPVLIIKKFSADVFFGLPLTSKYHSGSWYFPLSKKEHGYVILNQGRLYDRKRLENKILEISENELINIKKVYCELILKP